MFMLKLVLSFAWLCFKQNGVKEIIKYFKNLYFVFFFVQLHTNTFFIC